MPQLTNAQKAAIIVFVNALLSTAVVFGLPLSEVQFGALDLLVNTALGLYVALTYKLSPRRIPDVAYEEEDYLT